MPAPYDDETIARIGEVAGAAGVMKVVALAGGVGGAKLAEGLAAHLGADLTVVVNTGDDLERHGLPSGPTTTPWRTRWPGSTTRSAAGACATRPGPSMERLEALGGDDPWFRLGDRDLAHAPVADRPAADRRAPDGVARELRGARSASPRRSCR